jgi:hypothetical protein
MGFNYGLETKRFNAKWANLHREYTVAGMSEPGIQAIRDFDWEQLKSERRFRTHVQALDGAVFSNGDAVGEDQSPLLEGCLEQMRANQPAISEWGRYDWVEDIDTPELAKWLRSLSEKDLELITCLVMDGERRADLARAMGVSRPAVTKQINRMKKSLEKDGYQVNK